MHSFTSRVVLLLFIAWLGAIAFGFLSGCKKNVPTWNGKIYSVDGGRQSLRRAQENEEIPVANADGYMCFSPEDFASFVNTYIISCSEWRRDLDLVPFEKQVERVLP